MTRVIRVANHQREFREKKEATPQAECRNEAAHSGTTLRNPRQFTQLGRLDRRKSEAKTGCRVIGFAIPITFLRLREPSQLRIAFPRKCAMRFVCYMHGCSAHCANTALRQPISNPFPRARHEACVACSGF